MLWAVPLLCALATTSSSPSPSAPNAPPAPPAPPAPNAPSAPSAPPTSPAPPMSKGARVKVIVLDLKGSALTPSERAALGSLVTVSLSEFAALEVVSGAEIRELVALEGDRQAVGCEENMSCLAEMAGALGARIVAFGAVERLGSLYLLSLTMQDTKANTTVGRAALRGESVDALARAVPGEVHKMVLPFLAEKRLPLTTASARAGIAGDHGVLAWAGGAAALVGSAMFAATYIGGVAGAANAAESKDVLDTLRVPVAGKFQVGSERGGDGALYVSGVVEAAAATLAVGGAAAFAAAHVLDAPPLDGAGHVWRWGMVCGGLALAVGGLVFDATADSSNDGVLELVDFTAPALEVTGVAAAAVGILANPFAAAPDEARP